MLVNLKLNGFLELVLGLLNEFQVTVSILDLMACILASTYVTLSLL
jgi:hypothetical protein